MTDPIADMFNRIRNASAVKHETVKVPHSRVKGEIADLLAREGFLKEVDRKKEGVQKFLFIHLLYTEYGPRIQGIERVSTPGRRMYGKAKDLRAIRQGYGMSVISTSQGMMSDKEARKRKLGGELIGKIW